MDRFFGELDSHYFHQGVHYELYEKMGAHIREVDGVKGTQFVVWAPSARKISIVSDSNGWQPWQDNMKKMDDCIWELFIPGMEEGAKYKYCILGYDNRQVLKIDPYANAFEMRPNNASIVTNLDSYEWGDSQFLQNKKGVNFLEKPMAVYEVHLGSWKKDFSDGSEDGFLDYKTLAHQICEYVKYMGYTHIEVMGICEHPLDASWGYQVTGYFAPTARYGSPQDFMYFVDYMHQNGIGVILDWVPAHFPRDDWGLANFDGTKLYEYSDPLRSDYPEWGTLAFDLGKTEVSNFLIASAFFWVNKYHIDALRADAVAAMLYTSFGRQEWRPNMYGGNLNLESFAFFRHLNSVLRANTDAYLIAEDSSEIQGITAPAKYEGLGFGLKWNMGWMNDTLRYIKKDPVYRKYHHGMITHTFDYVFNENYILVLSHDEVVYGKCSLINKMPGNLMEKFGGLKVLYTMMMGHPGKKLLFMGQDFAQFNEWNFMTGLDWYLTDEVGNRQVMDCFRALLKLYTTNAVLYNDAGRTNTFEWINSGDVDRSIFAFIRRNPWNYNNALIFICNYTPAEYTTYTCGAPVSGVYNRVFTTYMEEDELKIEAEEELCDGRDYRLQLLLRPFEAVILEVPYHESTEQEQEREKEVRANIKKRFTEAKTDLSHTPKKKRRVTVKIKRK